MKPLSFLKRLADWTAEEPKQAVPRPLDAARMLGEAAALAPLAVAAAVLAGGAAVLAEAVLASGGVTREEALRLSLVASRAARTAAAGAGLAQQKKDRIAKQVETAAAIGALVGQGCHQHGARDASEKAHRMVMEELNKPSHVLNLPE